MDPLAPVPSSKEERTWAMACHLAAFAGFLTGIGFIVGPLVVWLLKKDTYPLVDDLGRESLNFQISVIIYYLISGLLMLVLIGFALLAIVAIFQFVMMIIATIKANEGEAYRYPLTIRFLK